MNLILQQQNSSSFYDHNTKLHYIPGKENNVADALSRQVVNMVKPDPDSNCATIQSEQLLTYTIQVVEKLINCLRNHIIIKKLRIRPNELLLNSEI